MDEIYLTIEAKRSEYSVNQIYSTLTVAELIGILEQYEDDTPVYISNDNGYTYGGISYSDIKEVYPEIEEEE